MFDQTLIEVKMERLKTLGHVIGKMMEVTSTALSRNLYHFGYALLWALPDLTTKVNYFDDLKKNARCFY